MLVMDGKYDLALKLSADKSGKINNAYTAMSMDNDGMLMYLRGDIMNKFFGMGCTFKDDTFGFKTDNVAEL